MESVPAASLFNPRLINLNCSKSFYSRFHAFAVLLQPNFYCCLDVLSVLKGGKLPSNYLAWFLIHFLYSPLILSFWLFKAILINEVEQRLLTILYSSQVLDTPCICGHHLALMAKLSIVVCGVSCLGLLLLSILKTNTRAHPAYTQFIKHWLSTNRYLYMHIYVYNVDLHLYLHICRFNDLLNMHCMPNLSVITPCAAGMQAAPN